MASAAPDFAADPRRRALIAKVKIAQKELGLDEDTYRGALMAATGHMSAGDCTIAELERAVEHFKLRGFKPQPGKASRAGARSRPADSPMARKARAMWISLHHLGAIDNPAEPALEAFARRQLGCAAMQWANQAQCYKLVEALKAIAERHGWRQRVDHVSARHQPFALKMGLCDAILAKMKTVDLVPQSWALGRAAFSLCGIGAPDRVLFEASELHQIAASLGTKLRAYQGNRP